MTDQEAVCSLSCLSATTSQEDHMTMIAWSDTENILPDTNVLWSDPGIKWVIREILHEFLIWSLDLFQELIGKLHQEVTAEYVRRLLKGEVKLKDQERQLKAYTTVKDNAESLHALFISMVRLEQKLQSITYEKNIHLVVASSCSTAEIPKKNVSLNTRQSD